MADAAQTSPDFAIAEVVSHNEMCGREGASLQRGMNFRLPGGSSVILLSRRPSAPYHDRFEEEGRVLIYEGHDVPRSVGGPPPKSVDQPMKTPGGKLTQNGKFYEAAQRARVGAMPELVRVYEKIQKGIWTLNGVFELVDAWVKVAVWRRDGGKCVKCGSSDHLHYDHVIPFSRGGASVTVENVQLLCARHNLQKRARIE